jgi:hypothetical protein
VRCLPALLLLAAASAQAAPVTYLCPAEKTEFKANFTPDRVQVSLGDVQLDLARVPAAGQALYVNKKLNASLSTLKREAVLKIGSSELRCEFFIKP